MDMKNIDITVHVQMSAERTMTRMKNPAMVLDFNCSCIVMVYG